MPTRPSRTLKGRLGIYDAATIADVDRNLTLLKSRLRTPHATRHPAYRCQVRDDMDRLLERRFQLAEPATAAS